MDRKTDPPEREKHRDADYMARGKLWRRLRSVIFLIPAWFAPSSGIRVFFHRLRGVKIGKNVEVGYFCIIGNVHPHLIKIEDGGVVTAGAVVLEHDNAHYYTKGGPVKYGPVTIKKNAFIGLHAVILPNVTIGERSIVGANSVVIRNVPPDAIVAGVPARILRRH